MSVRPDQCQVRPPEIVQKCTPHRQSGRKQTTACRLRPINDFDVCFKTIPWRLRSFDSHACGDLCLKRLVVDGSMFLLPGISELFSMPEPYFPLLVETSYIHCVQNLSGRAGWLLPADSPGKDGRRLHSSSTAARWYYHLYPRRGSASSRSHTRRVAMSGLQSFSQCVALPFLPWLWFWHFLLGARAFQFQATRRGWLIDVQDLSGLFGISGTSCHMCGILIVSIFWDEVIAAIDVSAFCFVVSQGYAGPGECESSPEYAARVQRDAVLHCEGSVCSYGMKVFRVFLLSFKLWRKQLPVGFAFTGPPTS